MRNKLWAIRMNKKMKTITPIIRRRTIFKWRLISMDRCTPNRNNKKQAAMKNKVKKRKLIKKWEMLRKIKKKKT